MGTGEFTREQLGVVHRAVVDAIRDADVKGFAALYEEDGHLLPPTGEDIRGRDAIAAAFQDWLDRGFCGQQVEVDEFAASGDLAMEAGRAFGEFRGVDGGPPVVAASTYLIVHRRQPDGSWLMVRDIWTAVPRGNVMRLAEYAEYDAMGLAELIRSGEVSANELHAVAVAAIESVEPVLNAVVEGPWPRPLDHAANGPFAGVPFVIKDILCHAAGTPTYLGSRLLAEGVTFEHDTELMRRFRTAGLATLATTRTPEFALSVSTEPLLGGPTRNPWDTGRSSGGSSGGTAALVAARAVPLGHANDGAGSIRIPAALTGLVGLKPSRGRVPIGPDQQEIMYGLCAELALSRSVRDTAAVLDAVSGWAPGEKSVAPAPRRPFVQEVDADPGTLRIAVHLDSWTEQATHPGVAEAVRSVAATLADLGHTVDFAAPRVDWAAFADALTTTWCAGTAAAVYPLAETLGVEVDESVVERTTLALAEHGRGLTVVDLARALGVYTTLSHEIGRFLDDWDVWLTPTSVAPPPPLGYFDANAGYSAEEWVARCTVLYPYCAMFNVSGTPAMTLPAGLVDGLPVGVQLAAPMGDEARLLRLAGQIEKARPWAGLAPTVRVGFEQPDDALHTSAAAATARP